VPATSLRPNDDDTSITLDRPYNVATTPPVSPMLDVGLLRQLSQQAAAEDEPAVSTSTVESIGSERLPRAGVFRGQMTILTGEAQQVATEGRGLMSALLTNTEIDLVHATNDRLRAQSTLAEAEQEHEQKHAVFTGAVPGSDDVAWTNGDVAAVQHSVEKEARPRVQDAVRGRKAERSERGLFRGLSRRSMIVVALLTAMEFALSYGMWQILIGGARADFAQQFAAFALTVLTTLTLSLLPYGLVHELAVASRGGRRSPKLLVLLVPIFVAFAIAIARQGYYVGRAGRLVDEAEEQVGETGAATALASAQATLDLYGSWWMTPLFAIVLLVGLLWIWIDESRHYNPHAHEYARAYASLLRARREDRRSQRALVEAEGAKKLQEIARDTHEQTFRRYIDETLPEFEQLAYDQYETELVRLKGDPDFTAAVVVRQSEDRDRRQAGGAQ